MFHFNRRKTLPASPEIEICAPCDGMLFPLESSADAVFAAKTLGEGFFIQPSDTLIYAPLSGTISALFPTKHAIGIQSEEGIEVLLHIGIDTVYAKGLPIESDVRIHERIRRGELLAQIDLTQFHPQNLCCDVYVFITDQKGYTITSVQPFNRQVYEGEVLMRCKKRAKENTIT